MNKTFKPMVSAVAVAFLTAVSSANAGLDLNGGFGFVPWFGGSASYSATSFKLDGQNLVNGAPTGDFIGVVPHLSYLTASTTTITGIGTSPTPASRPDYLIFSTPGLPGSAGTTPNNRFHFDLESIQRTGASVFAGNGRLRDVAGEYSDMTASFTLAFNGDAGTTGNNYNVTFNTITPIPEASTLWSGAGILVFGLGVGLRRLRGQAAA